MKFFAFCIFSDLESSITFLFFKLFLKLLRQIKIWLKYFISYSRGFCCRPSDPGEKAASKWLKVQLFIAFFQRRIDHKFFTNQEELKSFQKIKINSTRVLLVKVLDFLMNRFLDIHVLKNLGKFRGFPLK